MIQFADVEAVLVTALTNALALRGDSAKVSTRRTTGSPARLVRLTRTGGERFSLVEDRPLVTFECWDTTDPTAAELAAITRAECQNLYMKDVGGVFITWVDEAGGIAYYPSPDTTTPRYQHTQQFAVIGAEVTVPEGD